ncbi:RNA-binding protein 48 [Phymastichus coffea]|uniref:RNA-binding protein 48 n=1 Tax=Phymastichus coffea TaxID=108790 RepID=UPI00273CB4E8|nr:RNA-binding protein 48 [Phymastichus coffea]
MEKTPYKVEKLPHHEQQELCHTRAPYRQGRKLTAVKVYTINDESPHLIVSGVPTPNYTSELKKKFTPYGEIKEFHVISGYECEAFTEAVHVHYARIQSARIAKKFLDGFNFFGGVLHIFYAPELESLTETRHKLFHRRRDIAIRIKRHKEDPTNPEIDPFQPELELDDKMPIKRKKKRVADIVQGK